MAHQYQHDGYGPDQSYGAIVTENIPASSDEVHSIEMKITRLNESSFTPDDIMQFLPAHIPHNNPWPMSKDGSYVKLYKNDLESLFEI